MSESSWYKVNRPSVIHEAFEDEYVIVNLKTGAYYALDTIGAEVWDLVDRGLAEDEIVALLARQYEADPIEISSAIQAFLGELQQEALVIPQNGATANALPSPVGHPLSTERSPFVPLRLQKYTDMQDLLLLDPIHQVDESGWPQQKPS